MVKITLIDEGFDRYTVKPNTKILGRRYDDNAEEVSVLFPQFEIDNNSQCFMIVTTSGGNVEYKEVYHDTPFKIRNNISQFATVKIGFAFRKTDYCKNSQIHDFYTLDAQKPENFVPIDPEDMEKYTLLLGLAFTDVQWKSGTSNTLQFLNIDGVVKKEINLTGFIQEQADLGETDDTKETFVKGKKTSNLQNDGADGVHPYADSQDIDTLQTQIDAIVSKSDVVDVVGTYEQLLRYDTSKLKDKDVIKVLLDSTHNDARSYYRWIVTEGTGSWSYIGSEAIGYSKDEIDYYLSLKQDKTNAYESLSPVGDTTSSFLYDISYVDLDYESAKEHFNITSDVMSGFACSAIVKDGVLGRNFDWNYNNQATFRVVTSHLNGRYATTGIATMAGLNRDGVESGEYNELYKYLPFSMVDGQNEKGLQCAILVVPNDNGDTVNTPVTTSKSSTVISLNALMLIRYCLDHFATIDEVKEAIADHISIFVPQRLRDLGYECHFIFKDNEKVEVLEFIFNECVWTNITSKPILTNFFVNGVTFKSDGSIYQIGEEGISESGLTAHAQGLERYNLLLDGLNNDTMTIDQIMTSVKFTQLYKNEWADAWVSEYCGTHGLTIFDEKTQFYQTFIDGQEEFTRRSRDTGTTYQTVHCAIYDNSKLRVYTQENMGSSQSFEFPLQLDAGVHTIVCSDYTTIDGYNVPVVPFRPLLEALTTPFAILNNGTLCISQATCGKFYSTSLSWIDDNNVVISFVYDNVGILQYKTNLIDTVTPSLYPFNTRAGYYDIINDRFYTTIRFEEELKPSDKALYVDITDINAPVTYLCVFSAGQYSYIKIAGSLVTYVGNFTYNYTSEGGMVVKLPQIPQDDLMRIYNNEKKGVTHIIHWTDSDNVDHRFKLLNFKEVTISSITQYNVTILVSQKYICSYSWSPSGPSSLLLTPNVTEIGASSGTPDYPDLTNKPKINNVELIGNKTSSDLGLQDEITSQTEITIKKVIFGTNYVDDSTLTQTAQTITNLQSTKQNITDNTLQTTNKTIPSAINEVNSIAKGAQQTVSYSNYQTMITAFNSLASDAYNVGQNVMIVTLEVPDLWISSVETTSQAYTYTTDEAIVNALKTNGYIQVGYYKLSALETSKVDLTNYVQKTDNATSNEVEAKSSTSKFLTPANINKIIKSGLVGNTESLSDSDLESIHSWLGVGTILGSGAPTENTQGDRGMLYLDTVSSELYYCYDVSPDRTQFAWKKLINISQTISSSSTHSEVASAKAVYDLVGNIETLLGAL